LQRKASLVLSMRPLSIEDKAYIAGLVDGEGTLTINYKLHKERGDGCYQPIVGIDNTNKAVINWIHDVTGLGYVNTQRNKGSSGSSKPMFRWRVHKIDDVAMFLDQITPFLTIKRRLGELIKDCCKLRMQRKIFDNRTTSSGRPWSEEEIQILREHYPKHNWEVLLELLPDRNSGAIMHKAWRLGIKPIKGYYSDRELKIISEVQQLNERGCCR